MLMHLFLQMLLLLQEMQELFQQVIDGARQQAQVSSVFANNLDQYFIAALDCAPR